LLAYDGGMRYGQRGGYRAAEQQRRERLRLQAAKRFAAGVAARRVTKNGPKVLRGNGRLGPWGMPLLGPRHVGPPPRRRATAPTAPLLVADR
jgi:hypothetical protein